MADSKDNVATHHGHTLFRYPSQSNLSWAKQREALEENKSSEDVMKATDQTLLWKLMSTYIATDVPTIQRQLSDHVEYTLACDRSNFTRFNAYQATAYTVRDRLIEFWNDTNFRFFELNCKRVYYLSIEYLLGRSLGNSLLNIEMEKSYSNALKQFGYDLEDLYDEELDAGLGNGGLGRLAACYLDSMATKNYPVWGYGLRYTYGMFRQQLHEGWQAEIPDLWLKGGNPWEVPRWDRKYPVRFGGEVRTTYEGDQEKHIWEGGEVVLAVPYDTPVPGYDTLTTINLRLWSSEPTNEFDLKSFNEGNYYRAIERRQAAESISSVLYPNDSTDEGKLLRLKQQYFFSCATLQDIIRSKVAIQLNDTHPTVSIPELLRILVDEQNVPWDQAKEICSATFAYTNHTVLPEALEKWKVPYFERLLPRHLQLIYRLNHDFVSDLRKKNYSDEVIRQLSIIEESHPKMVRMANLAIIVSHTVNGVAKLHTDILKANLFKHFHELHPTKFMNVTNGITPRRWLLLCNPKLTKLISKTLHSEKFLNSLDKLAQLKQFVSDETFQKKWMAIKMQNKMALAGYLKEHCGVEVDPSALFDIQVKRIHEYKRQFMNILRVIHAYLQLKKNKSLGNAVPRVVVFGGKAAPSYKKAKHIIKLITSVAEKVNRDEDTKDFLKVVFIPNYNVSLAEKIVPANDISQHISTAGLEASGTSNMKFALNAGLIVGTLDGANIEIRDAIGHDNMFIFGLTADKVEEQRRRNASIHVIQDPRLQEVVNTILSGTFGDPSYYYELVDSLIPSRDFYLLGTDFASYINIHEQVDKEYKDQKLWARKSILSTAGMGMFSSDRSVEEYASKIWKVDPIIPEKRAEGNGTPK